MTRSLQEVHVHALAQGTLPEGVRQDVHPPSVPGPWGESLSFGAGHVTWQALTVRTFALEDSGWRGRTLRFASETDSALAYRHVVSLILSEGHDESFKRLVGAAKARLGGELPSCSLRDVIVCRFYAVDGASTPTVEWGRDSADCIVSIPQSWLRDGRTGSNAIAAAGWVVRGLLVRRMVLAGSIESALKEGIYDLTSLSSGELARRRVARASRFGSVTWPSLVPDVWGSELESALETRWKMSGWLMAVERDLELLEAAADEAQHTEAQARMREVQTRWQLIAVVLATLAVVVTLPDVMEKSDLVATVYFSRGLLAFLSLGVIVVLGIFSLRPIWRSCVARRLQRGVVDKRG